MPDISMCKLLECPKHLECYRFMAVPDERQWYAAFELTDNGCESFMEIKLGQKLTLKSVRRLEIQKSSPP